MRSVTHVVAWVTADVSRAERHLTASPGRWVKNKGERLVSRV